MKFSLLFCFLNPLENFSENQINLQFLIQIRTNFFIWVFGAIYIENENLH